MRVKFTIAVCALLMLGLAVTQVNAQGFNVSKSERDVAEHGRNQMMGAIRLDYTLSGGNIDDGRTITVNYNNLRITTTTINTGTATLIAWCCIAVWPSGGFRRGPACTAITATVANDADTGVGTVTISMGTAGRAAGSFVILRGVRADVSALSAGDKIVASINSSSAPTGFVPIGQERTESVGGTVSTVKGGLTVKVGQASRLLCNLGESECGDALTQLPVGGIPSITVSEAFARAWEEDAIGDYRYHDRHQDEQSARGSELAVAACGQFHRSDDGPPNSWSTLTLTNASRQTAGIVDGADDGTLPIWVRGKKTITSNGNFDANNGEMVTYEYTIEELGRTENADKTVDTEKDSFKIEFEVTSPTWRRWGPAASPTSGPGLRRQGRPVTTTTAPPYCPTTCRRLPIRRSTTGDIINFGECVTYLLFPYLTCGDSANWTTAIAIANTTLDDGVFGISGGAAAQGGNIMLHAFPRSVMGEDGMMMMHDPMSMELTENLAAGDTYRPPAASHARVCRLCHRQGRLPACPWSGLCAGQFRWRRYHRFGPRLSGSGDS